VTGRKKEKGNWNKTETKIKGNWKERKAVKTAKQEKQIYTWEWRKETKLKIKDIEVEEEKLLLGV